MRGYAEKDRRMYSRYIYNSGSCRGRAGDARFLFFEAA